MTTIACKQKLIVVNSLSTSHLQNTKIKMMGWFTVLFIYNHCFSRYWWQHGHWPRWNWYVSKKFTSKWWKGQLNSNLVVIVNLRHKCKCESLYHSAYLCRVRLIETETYIKVAMFCQWIYHCFVLVFYFRLQSNSWLCSYYERCPKLEERHDH